MGGSLESRGCRFFPRPNLLNTLPAPTSGGARPHRGGGREGRRGLSPQLAAVLPPSNPASASAHPSTSPEPREMRTPNPWAPVALPQQWDPFRRRKLQAGKFRVRTAPGDVATSLCPALPWGVSVGGVSGGGGTHLPSAIALFILGVGEGTSGGAKSSGGGTILEKAEQVLVQKLQPERGAERGEGALPVPVPSLIGGMSSPRAGVSIQARLPLPPCPPACLLPPSSLPPAARTGPGPELRRIPRRQSRRRRRGARSLAAADPGSERAGRGAWRGDECFMGSCGLT